MEFETSVMNGSNSRKHKVNYVGGDTQLSIWNDQRNGAQLLNLKF